jgi:short subunit dehydrogenase-like uncharacterized protein
VDVVSGAAPNPRVRDRSRPYDIVLFGATGFTGKLVAEYLAPRLADSDLRLALAGRDVAKLEAVRASLAAKTPRAAELPLLRADSADRASLDALAAQASVVCTTVGPYARYGAELVAACVAHGTDYCDLTGEVQFIRRMIDAHHAEAERTGARIVHCCGFDSIPSDLGTFMLQEAMRAKHGVPLDAVHFFAGESRGGVSGGTIASMLTLLEEAKRDRAVRRIVGDPYALVPDAPTRGPDGSDQRGVRHDAQLGMWTGPFVMAAINTRIVRRSNALLDYAYGEGFRYAEAMSTGKGAAGLFRATAMTAGLGAALGALQIAPLRSLLAKHVLPAPGEGPSAEAREKGFFVVRLVGEGRAGDGAKVLLRGRVEGKGDPGYAATARMLGESALCLALDGAKLDAPGGIRTPASTMGTALLARLRDAGMVFRVEEG